MKKGDVMKVARIRNKHLVVTYSCLRETACDDERECSKQEEWETDRHQRHFHLDGQFQRNSMIEMKGKTIFSVTYVDFM